MKYKSLLKLLTLGFSFVFILASCTKEGPMGPAGANGTDGTDGRDGVDGNVTCLVCHSSTTIEQKSAEFAMSEHSLGAIAVDYAGGRASCAPCHSHEQFVETMTLGGVAGDITNPSAWECSTCHGIHKTFEGQDFALRTTDAISPNFNKDAQGNEIVAGVTIDFNGSSNLCAVCHQSRTAEPAYAQEAPAETFKISSTHWGPHHGPQSNVVYGIGFAEIEGSVAYPAPGSSYHMEASCTGCHMAPFSNKEGGHSFIPNLDACIECHDAEMDDYNYGGTQTAVEEMLVELRDELVTLGVMGGNDVDGYHVIAPATYSMVQAQAYFNWIGLEEDRSLGVHNPKYVKALLLNTIEALKAEETASN